MFASRPTPRVWVMYNHHFIILESNLVSADESSSLSSYYTNPSLFTHVKGVTGSTDSQSVLSIKPEMVSCGRVKSWNQCHTAVTRHREMWTVLKPHIWCFLVLQSVGCYRRITSCCRWPWQKHWPTGLLCHMQVAWETGWLCWNYVKRTVSTAEWTHILRYKIKWSLTPNQMYTIKLCDLACPSYYTYWFLSYTIHHMSVMNKKAFKLIKKISYVMN